MTLESSPVVVMGMGYVGLSIGIHLAQAGIQIIGLESDSIRRDAIQTAQVPGWESALSDLLGTGCLKIVGVPEVLGLARTVLVCVPTPLVGGHPDPSAVLDAASTVSLHAPLDALVILESTVAPGFVEEQFAPRLAPRLVAFSPERVDPCHPGLTVGTTPRLVSGMTPEAEEGAGALHRAAGIPVHRVPVRVAELAKLLENTQRLVNIAFVDEFARLCSIEGVNVDTVVSAASTKPFGFVPYQAGPGAGGHCIPVVPAFLTERAGEKGMSMPLVEQALASNRARPSVIVEETLRRANGAAHPTALLVGVAYKPNVSDARESPADPIRIGLEAKGWQVRYHDPRIPSWRGQASMPLASTDLEKTTVVILVSPHPEIDKATLLAHQGPIIDARGFLAGLGRPNVYRV